MEIKHSIDSNIKTIHTVEQILSVVKDYRNTYDLDGEGVLRSVELNPQFDVEGRVAWIVRECYILFGEERDYFYVVSDKTGSVEYTMNEHGTYYPHLEKEQTEEEKKEDEAFLQELRDEGFDFT